MADLFTNVSIDNIINDENIGVSLELRNDEFEIKDNFRFDLTVYNVLLTRFGDYRRPRPDYYVINIIREYKGNREEKIISERKEKFNEKVIQSATSIGGIKHLETLEPKLEVTRDGVFVSNYYIFDIKEFKNNY